jgi:hypothetical protein
MQQSRLATPPNPLTNFSRDQYEKILRLNEEIVRLKHKDLLTTTELIHSKRQNEEELAKVEALQEQFNRYRSDKSEEIIKLNEEIEGLRRLHAETSVRLNESISDNSLLRNEMKWKYFHNLPVLLYFLILFYPDYTSPNQR